MADIVDYANDLIQLQISNILENRIFEKSTYYKACRNCEEQTPSGHAFCNKECRDDFEKWSKKSIWRNKFAAFD